MNVRVRHLEGLGSVALLAFGIVFFIGDWAATTLVLSAMPGVAAEANPLAAPIIAAGPVCALAVKVVGSIGAVTIFFVARSLDLRALSWFVALLLVDLGTIGMVSALLATRGAT